MTKKERRMLECAECGQPTGPYEQYWNQDDGYGVCRRCVNAMLERGADHVDIHEIYGMAFVHRPPTIVEDALI
jgi:ribosomal protein S14